METLCDVDGYVVDTVLHGALAQGSEHFRHLTTVGVGDFCGLEFELAAAFEVDEEVRASVVIEVHLVGKVVGVENDDFVLVVAQMP